MELEGQPRGYRIILLINKCDSFMRVMLIGTDRRTTQQTCHPLPRFPFALCADHSMSSTVGMDKMISILFACFWERSRGKRD